MKKIIMIALMSMVTIFLTGCNELVPAGTKGKILGPTGWQQEVYPPSKVWLSNNIWNINHEKLFLVETTTKKYVQPIHVLLSDKLNLSAEIVFRGRVTSNDKVVNAIFNDMKMNDNVVTTDEVYNTYGKMVVLNTAREVISKYSVDEVNKNYQKITLELYNAIKPKLKGLPIEISDVTMGNIQYPKIVTQAIEKAKERRMLIEQEKANVQIALTKAKGAEEVAKATYRIKMMEAKRQADYNAKISESLTPRIIKMRELEIRQQELNKWNGILPTTVVGTTNVPIIVNSN